VGFNQAKLQFDLVSELQQFGDSAQYVKIGGNGQNALDFHIAYYIGELSSKNPDSYFHIISKDTGFDPLIKHLKSRKIFVQRSKDLAEIPLLKISNATSSTEKITAIIENLTARGQSRPRRLKTLSNTIKTLFMKKLEDAEIEELIGRLEKNGVITVTQEKISYKFCDKKSASPGNVLELA
jgi:hypothetical protein